MFTSHDFDAPCVSNYAVNMNILFEENNVRLVLLLITTTRLDFIVRMDRSHSMLIVL